MQKDQDKSNWNKYGDQDSVHEKQIQLHKQIQMKIDKSHHLLSVKSQLF